MSDRDIKVIIDTNLSHSDESKKIYKMQYTMDFSDISIVYEFCLN